MRSIRLAAALLHLAFIVALAPRARGDPEVHVSLDDALRAARRASPDLAVSRAREAIAHADVGIAGVYPNPSVAAATSTEAAKLSGTLSLPLVILGQRAASIDAARADEATVTLDTQVAWNELRQATERAFAALWLAEGVADARIKSRAIATTLESSVVQRVQVGSAPQLEALRVHAEKLRADADVILAVAQVSAAGSELGRWMGATDGGGIRTDGTLPTPDTPPPLNDLLARLDASAALRREQSDVRAAGARADRERALVRPTMGVDIGFDAFDPTLGNGNLHLVNYRAQLLVDVPLLNQRGPYIERERAQGDVARARVRAARVQASAELTAAYRMFEADTARWKTLEDSVIPAALGAATATEEAYALGRAQLFAVLDSERALVDARLTALEARAARANAWTDVEHSLGAP